MPQDNGGDVELSAPGGILRRENPIGLRDKFPVHDDVFGEIDSVGELFKNLAVPNKQGRRVVGGDDAQMSQGQVRSGGDFLAVGRCKGSDEIHALHLLPESGLAHDEGDGNAFLVVHHHGGDHHAGPEYRPDGFLVQGDTDVPGHGLVELLGGNVPENPAREDTHRLGDVLFVFFFYPGHLGVDVVGPHEVAGHEGSVSLLGDLDPVHRRHFPQDDLDVLVVDGHALGSVDFLDLVHEGPLDRLDPLHLEHLLGVHVALGDLVALPDLIPFLDQKVLADGDVVGSLFLALAVSGGDDDLPLAFHDPDFTDPAVHAGQVGNLLGPADFKELFDPGETLGDVLAGEADAARMEGPHGELCSRLADGLGRHDTHGLADGNFLPGGQVHAVAHLAHAVPEAAGQGAPDPHGFDSRLFYLFRRLDGDAFALRRDHGAGRGVSYVVQGGAAVDPLRKGDHDLAVLLQGLDADAVVRAAVMVRDDEILGHVHEPPGEVSRLGRPEGGVGKPLPGAVGGDEVLEHVHPLAEVRRDGIVYDPARRVGHEAPDARHLAHLASASPGAAVAHHADGVGALHVLHNAVDNGP
ncbi:hypothetical protein SDC9_45272 [bioreactor metagenome]|uniref:NAD-specific glutamate dehydrogenase n=1 Tax=bioreactor metagenome TaxID=1076179 RepID=A0A644W652_9ZZZZ